MKRLPWKYIAGFTDADGCIDVIVGQGKYISPRIRIAQAVRGKHVLEMLHNSHGGYIHFRESHNENWSDSCSWELSGYKKTCMLLRNIVNHMHLKKEQARFCLWMETHIKGKHVSTGVRDAIRKEFKAMKKDPHRLSEIAQENILGML